MASPFSVCNSYQVMWCKVKQFLLKKIDCIFFEHVSKRDTLNEKNSIYSIESVDVEIGKY